jgi:hypothetical protein
MGTKQDLWRKLIVRPLAAAKLSRTALRQTAAPWEVLQRISVSSAYSRTGQGRSGESGWQRCPSLLSLSLVGTILGVENTIDLKKGVENTINLKCSEIN